MKIAQLIRQANMAIVNHQSGVFCMRKSVGSISMLALGVATLLLTGCATDACDGKHGGICTSPRLVWGVTRNRDQVNPTKRTLRDQNRARKLLHEKPSRRDRLPSISPTSKVIKGQTSSTGSGALADSTSTNPPIRSGQMPLLTQPRIIRVWIAPWSHQNTLHFPGYVYRVVQPEQWRYAPAGGTTPVPTP